MTPMTQPTTTNPTIIPSQIPSMSGYLSASTLSSTNIPLILTTNEADQSTKDVLSVAFNFAMLALIIFIAVFSYKYWQEKKQIQEVEKQFKNKE